MKTLLLFVVISLSSFITFAEAPVPPQIQHGKIFKSVADPEHYFVSEKLDGVRGYWNGESLFTRKGYVIHAPSWFTENWPNIALDGELWIKRQAFEQVSSIVRSQQARDVDWQQVKFMLFDVTRHSGTFAERVALMRDIVAKCGCQTLKMIPQTLGLSQSQIQKRLVTTIANGGEGLMLHHQDAMYQTQGRNPKLLKLKTYQDAEAKVLEILPGKGKYTGMMGALKVINEHGQIFKIGTGFTKQLRQHPPKVGTLITYKYWGLTRSGKPRFASFMRIRED